jgi:hypothetical protein
MIKDIIYTHFKHKKYYNINIKINKIYTHFTLVFFEVLTYDVEILYKKLCISFI